MEIYLTKGTGTREITDLLASVRWSGDKATITRTMVLSILYVEGSSWPEPELGDVVTMFADGENRFEGYVVHRSLDSEDDTLDFYCYDRGMYLSNNDGTYKFRGASADGMVLEVCRDKGIPVAELAPAGSGLSRKFSGVKLAQIITTAYSMAAEQTGERYAFRMTPEGLLVKIKTQSASSLKLRPRSNLIRASTTESIVNMVNQVAIYDEQGTLLDRISDQQAVNLYGVMERHITARGEEDATAEAAALLEDGAMARTVTVEVLGDLSLITGETVVVEEASTHLKGVFWIDADTHYWKNAQYTCKLTLNCRSVMTTTNAGSELT